MSDKKPGIIVCPRGLMSRPPHDVRGNARIDGGTSIGRMYIARTRLQHVCDTGASAERKRDRDASQSLVGPGARPAAYRPALLPVYQF